MNKELKHTLFTPTDCLSEQTMFDYIDNKLSDKERHQVEKHLLGCDLCSDAMEGLELVKDRSRTAAINKEIDIRITPADKKETTVIKFNYRIVSAIAAGLLLLIGGVFFFNQFTKKELLQDKLAEVKSPQLLSPADEKPITTDAAENQKELKNQKDVFLDSEKTKKQDKLGFTKQEKLRPDIGNAIVKGETGTASVTTTNGIAVTKSDGDRDKKLVNIPVQAEQDESKMVAQEMMINDATPKKTEAIAGDNSGYVLYRNEDLAKQKDNAEKKREIKKVEEKPEGDNGRFGLADGKKDKAAKEAEQMMAVTGKITSAPQTIAANKNQDFETTVSRGDNRMLADSVFAGVEPMPEFPGGTDSLSNFLHTNFHYPADYYNWNASQGTKIIVAFTVDTSGKVINPKIIKGINTELNNEALRVVNKMPNWKPAAINGKPVPKIVQLPIQLEFH